MAVMPPAPGMLRTTTVGLPGMSRPMWRAMPARQRVVAAAGPDVLTTMVTVLPLDRSRRPDCADSRCSRPGQSAASAEIHRISMSIPLALVLGGQGAFERKIAAIEQQVCPGHERGFLGRKKECAAPRFPRPGRDGRADRPGRVRGWPPRAMLEAAQDARGVDPAGRQRIGADAVGGVIDREAVGELDQRRPCWWCRARGRRRRSGRAARRC